MLNRYFLVASAMISGSALVACGGADQTAEYPATGGYGASYTPAGSGAGNAYGGAGACHGQGGAGATPVSTGGGSTTPAATATPIPAHMAALASPILKGLAQKETAGMSEDGTAVAGQFQQGQILEQPIQLQPGKCYAVVGVGIGITELDIELVVHQPPAPEWIAAQGSMQGPQEILGGSGNCFKNPLPVGGPAKVRIRATGGSGVALAQVFSK